MTEEQQIAHRIRALAHELDAWPDGSQVSYGELRSRYDLEVKRLVDALLRPRSEESPTVARGETAFSFASR